MLLQSQSITAPAWVLPQTLANSSLANALTSENFLSAKEWGKSMTSCSASVSNMNASSSFTPYCFAYNKKQSRLFDICRQERSIVSSSRKKGSRYSESSSSSNRPHSRCTTHSFNVGGKPKSGILPRNASVEDSLNEVIRTREGPTNYPPHIQVDHPQFSSSAPSPLMLYYFDETAPNSILIDNDIREEHPIELAKKHLQSFCVCTHEPEKAVFVEGDSYSNAVFMNASYYQESDGNKNGASVSSSSSSSLKYNESNGTVVQSAHVLAHTRSGCCGVSADTLSGSSTTTLQSSYSKSSSIQSLTPPPSNVNNAEKHHIPRDRPARQSHDYIANMSHDNSALRLLTESRRKLSYFQDTVSHTQRRPSPEKRRWCLQLNNNRSHRSSSNQSGSEYSQQSTENVFSKFSTSIPLIYVSPPSPDNDYPQLLSSNNRGSGSHTIASALFSVVSKPLKKTKTAAWCQRKLTETSSSNNSTCSSETDKFIRRRCPLCKDKGYIFEKVLRDPKNSISRCNTTARSSEIVNTQPQTRVNERDNFTKIIDEDKSILMKPKVVDLKKWCCSQSVISATVPAAEEESFDIASAYIPVEDDKADLNEEKNITGTGGASSSHVISEDAEVSSCSDYSSTLPRSNSTSSVSNRIIAKKNQIKEMFFKVDNNILKDSNNIFYPSYSTSYKNYPLICYERIVVDSPQDIFFKPRLAPILQQ